MCTRTRRNWELKDLPNIQPFLPIPERFRQEPAAPPEPPWVPTPYPSALMDGQLRRQMLSGKCPDCERRLTWSTSSVFPMVELRTRCLCGTRFTLEANP